MNTKKPDLAAFKAAQRKQETDNGNSSMPADTNPDNTPIAIGEIDLSGGQSILGDVGGSVEVVAKSPVVKASSTRGRATAEKKKPSAAVQEISAELENTVIIDEAKPTVVPVEDDFGDDEDFEVLSEDDVIDDVFKDDGDQDDSHELSVEVEGELVPIEMETEIIQEPLKIGTIGERKGARALSAFKPSSNVKVFAIDDSESQQDIIEQYFNKTAAGPSSIVGPRGISRVVMPYSGIFYDISTYTNKDFLDLNREGHEVSFVEQIEMELYSAFKHTVNNSFKKNLTFNEWLKNIKLPDIWCIYWGMYNVNYPGINSYSATCDNAKCNHLVREKRENTAITFVADPSADDISGATISDIRNGYPRENIKAYEVAEKLIQVVNGNLPETDDLRNFLPDSKMRVFQGIPNMDEVLAYLKYLKQENDVPDSTLRSVLYPISDMAVEGLSKKEAARVLIYKYGMYVRKIHVPIFKEVKNPDGNSAKIIARYGDADPRFIPGLINDLTVDDFKVLSSGTEIRKYMIKEGIQFRVRNSKCPKCGSTQRETALDMREILFSRAAGLEDFVMTT